MFSLHYLFIYFISFFNLNRKKIFEKKDELKNWTIYEHFFSFTHKLEK